MVERILEAMEKNCVFEKQCSKKYTSELGRSLGQITELQHKEQELARNDSQHVIGVEQRLVRSL